MKPIPGLDGHFATEDGRIFSSVRELSQQSNRSGYPCVRVHRNGVRVRQPVHKLVALTFLAKPEGASLIRHLDGSKTNNHVSNLAWGTAIENAADMIRHGRSVRGRKIARSHHGENNPNAH